MYDKNHKLISFVPVKYQNDSKVKKPSSGEYESGILCQECDNSILGSYETYGHNVIYGGTFKQGKKPICHNTVEADLTILNCRNIDYSKLKLFYLSLLWRASISSRPMFKAVDLGTKYTDRIRQMFTHRILERTLNLLLLLLPGSKTNQPPRICSYHLVSSKSAINTCMYSQSLDFSILSTLRLIVAMKSYLTIG